MAADPSSSSQSLPVVVKKGRHQLGGLTEGPHGQHWLCPHGKLTAFVDGRGWLRIQHLSSPQRQATISTHTYSSCIWINKAVTSGLDISSSNESFLLGVTSYRDLHLFSVQHQSTLHDGGEEGGEGDGEGEGERSSSVALLVTKQLCSMSKRQITSILSKAQLGSSLDTLIVLGSCNGDIILQANTHALVRLTLHSSSTQQLSMSLSSVFSIEPNMESFQYDESLPQYVGKVNDVVCKWPLLFTLTEDGIVLIYSIPNAKVIAAVHPLEYCRMFSSHHSEGPSLLQSLSLSSFHKLSVSPDLLRLSVSTKTNHILTVDLPVYFITFSSHYSKNFRQKPIKRTPPTQRLQDSSISQEEELDRARYGGLRRREKGAGHVGSFIGHYTVSKRYSRLMRNIEKMNLSEGKNLSLGGVSKLPKDLNKPVKPVSDDKWYMPSHGAWSGKTAGGGEMEAGPLCVTSMRKTKPLSAKTSGTAPDSTHSGSRYPIQCILPPPDGHVTSDSALLYLHYNNGLVMAYYGRNGNGSSGMSTGGMEEQEPDHRMVDLIVIYKISERSYSLANLSRQNWLILPTNEDKPVYLVSENSLSVAAFLLSQEDFVAKVLMYGSASVAEEVCHLNRWDQCSLPLNALETALELRQLDIVSFFLRNRDDSHGDKRKSSCESLPSPPPIPPDQLDAAVNLLSSIIRRNHTSEHNHQFAGQLLRMTLNFLLRFIKTHSRTSTRLSLPRTESADQEEAGLVRSDSQVSEDSSHSTVEKSLKKLSNISAKEITGHIHNLRQFLPKGSPLLKEKFTKRKGAEEGEEFDRLLHVMVRKESWDHASTEIVVQRSLVTGNMPLAQAYLIQRSLKGEESPHPQDEPSPAHPEEVTLKSLSGVGIGLIMKTLSDKNVKQAINYIRQMGANVQKAVRYIFRYTLQKQLRDTLAELMSEEGWLTSVEQEALEYLKMLETYYPTDVYETAKMLYSSTSQSYQPPIAALSPVSTTGNILDMYPETFGGDHPVVWVSVSTSLSSTNATQRGLYLETPLASVLGWDGETRQKILFDAIVISGASKDPTQTNRLVSSEDQFRYHLLHQDLEAARKVMPSLSRQTSYSLVLSTSLCNTHCRDMLMDQLVRDGYTGDMDLQKILYHLGRLHNLFSRPHPLSTSTDLVGKFHIPFIHYLIQSQFVGLLYIYLNHYKLALTSQSISELRLGIDEVPPWVNLLVQCRLTGINPNEPERVFGTSLACSKLLFNTSTISSGITAGHILASLATLMYSPVTISEAIDSVNSNEVWSIDEGLLKQSLAAYPTLQAAIFPSRQAKLTPSESQDVTLYELLKGTVPFDISRLFKWQKTNKFAAANEDIDASEEMPHFSHPSLTQQSTHSIKLTYTYYLYQGQPSFAFANFVAAKLSNISNINKRVDKAVSKVYRLAMSDFTNSCLVSSCVAFTEMLSRESTHLRIDTQSAIRIFNHRMSTEGWGSVTSPVPSVSVKDGGGGGSPVDTGDASGGGGGGSSSEAGSTVGESDEVNEVVKNKIAGQFLQLYQSSDSSGSILSSLLHSLIEATKYEVSTNSFQPHSVEAENIWLLVQRFCQYHSLPPSNAYLIECAKSGAWLSLLCHAQLHRILPQEVLSVVEKHFSNPVLKEHLQLALSTIEATPIPSSPALSDNSANGRGKSRKRRHTGGSAGKRKRSSDSKGDSLTPRDVRAKFYSKVGLGAKKDEKPVETPPSSARAESVVTKTLSPSLLATVVLEGTPAALTEEDLPADLFPVLFQCQDHPQPSWRALLAYSIGLQRPLLALLASYYEDSSLLDCMCVWLVATIGSHSLKRVAEPLKLPLSDCEELHFSAELQWKVWSATDLGLVLLAGVLNESVPGGHFPLLFHYFDECNPLYSFMKFHEEFTVRCDLKESKEYLNQFNLQMDKCKVQGYPAKVGGVQWVEEIATTFANRMIVTCPTPFERMQLCKLLAEIDFGQQFSCQVIDFSQLYKMSHILDKAGLSTVPPFKLTDEFISSHSSSLLEMYKVRVRVDGLNTLQELVVKGQFAAAKEYAQVADIPTAEVTLKEAESNYHRYVGTSYWQHQPARISFWEKCHRSFITDRVRPEAAVEFFESIVKQSSVDTITHNERTLLLVLVYHWKRETGQSFSIQETERDIWTSHIRAVMMHLKSNGQQPSLPELITDPMLSPTLHPRQISPTLLPILSTLSVVSTDQWNKIAQIHQLVLPETVAPFVTEKDKDRSNSVLSKEEEGILDIVLGRLLNACRVKEARELANLFQYDSPDLTIVLCCIKLAQGEDHLTNEVLELLANRPPRRVSAPSLTPPLGSDESSSSKNKLLNDVIKMLQQLSDRANHAHKCCLCIMSCFKIALALRRSYVAVVGADIYDTLADLLSSTSQEKYTLAKSLVSSSNMQGKEIAGFLSECIAASLQCYIGGEEHDYSRVKVYEPHMTTSNFMSLAQLCIDHALLGSHLLTMTKSLLGEDQPSEASLSMQVELLIRSHDCYSLGCSVDGIAEVLKVCRDVTYRLYRKKLYKLMVRVLTGVGRFHEMTYIIQLLLECDQFEALVHHGVENVEQLRVALMDYLRKNCRNDHEKMQMVALKFGMYRDLARVKEEQALRDMKRLKHRSLGSDSIQFLKRIYTDLNDASKSYAQYDCLSSAEFCISQARLVALQLAILQSGKVIINMEAKEVRKFMEEQPFSESLIIAEAYKHTILADWVNPLYHKVILKGNMRYLNDYRSVYSLTPAIVQELASRYLLDRNRGPDSSQNMIRVLSLCPNLSQRYKLSKQLGLPLEGTQFDEDFLKDVSKL